MPNPEIEEFAKILVQQVRDAAIRGTDRRLRADSSDVTDEICTKWNERESTWRKSWACQSRGTNQSKS
jgi:hypothetical protein